MQPYASIFAWIDRQPWPDDVKAEAKRLHASLAERNLNPWTGSRWASWAKARNLQTTLTSN